MRKQALLKVAKIASRQSWLPIEQRILLMDLQTKAENKAYNEPQNVFENIFDPTPEQLEHMERNSKRIQRGKRRIIRRKNKEFSARALRIYYKTGKPAY